MPQISLAPRNVVVHDGTANPPLVVAGCCQLGTMTNAELYMCLSICFRQPLSRHFRLMAADQSLLPNDRNILPIGQYYVVTSTDPAQYMPVELTAESAQSRLTSAGPSPAATPRTSRFKNRVRARDGRCMISWVDFSALGFYGQQACHIIPRNQVDFAPSVLPCLQLIRSGRGDGGLDSVQNGLLLNVQLHYYWDNWGVSMYPLHTNPPSYRVMFFVPTLEQQAYDGRVIQFNNSPTLPAPPAALLYEHFKQAVLANMKGAGKVPFLDFDPDEDSRSLATFDNPEGKIVIEQVMMNKLSGNDRHWKAQPEAPIS